MLSELPVRAYAVATAPNALAKRRSVVPRMVGQRIGSATRRQ